MFAAVEAFVKLGGVKFQIRRVLFQLVQPKGANVLEQDIMILPVFVLLASAP